MSIMKKMLLLSTFAFIISQIGNCQISENQFLNPLNSLSSEYQQKDLKILTDSVHTLYYNSGSTSWDLNFREFNEYNQWCNITSKLTLSWDNILGDFENNSRQSWIYGPGQYTLMMISQSWDDVGSVWVNTQKYVYENDINGGLNKLTTFQWNNIALDWENDWREIYEYDEYGNMISRKTDFWDGGCMMWVQDSKIEFSYVNNNVASYIFYFYDSLAEVWEAIMMAYYYYDASQYLVKTETYFMNSSIPGWEISGMTEYFNDTVGNCYQETYYFWDNITSSFESSSRILRTFDSNNSVDTMTYYSWNTTQWDPLFKYLYFYTDVTGIQETAHSLPAFKVFPVPAEGELFIEISNPDDMFLHATIVNAAGQKIETIELNQMNTKIDISKYSSGLYIIYLSGIERTESLEFIKQ
jgi:hypothetical protein